MNGFKQVLRNLLQLLLVGIILAAAFVTAPFLIDMSVNSFEFNRRVAAFRKIDHPQGTKLIKRQKAFGLLTGSGSHCDYFVGEVRSYSGSQEDILDFYDEMRLENYGYVWVVFPEDGRLPEEAHVLLPHSLRSLDAWQLAPEDLVRDDLYIVYYLGLGPGSSYDFRC